jgi:ActR/RegA family two-component response regulator
VGSPLGRRALIVDSNAMYGSMLGEYMAQWGMRTQLAESSAEALSLARAARAAGEPFQFAVVDLRLQDERGQPLAHALKEVCGDELNVIRLTPALWTPDEREAAEPGAFLAKPVRASERTSGSSVVICTTAS